MVKAVTVVVNEDDDEQVVQAVATILRSNSGFARQIRDCIGIMSESTPPPGLQFQPKPGHILACHFGLGFQKPEIVKTRPVLVISPKSRVNKRLCTVIPISSGAPDPVEPYHMKLPKGLIPNKKYDEAWIKGDLIQTVGFHRLDRLKVAPRKYETPCVDDATLREVRRCILHASGMHTLTEHW